MRRRQQPAVPQWLVDRIEVALAAVDVARAGLAEVIADRAPRTDRRRAHARVRQAYDAADALLREATALARQRSYGEWSQWRHRLSTLDTARQNHLFAERDDSGLLAIGSVRALDTGMSGPAIGDLLHGESCEPGALPGYGLDLEAVLTGVAGRGTPTTAGPRPVRVVGPLDPRPAEPAPAAPADPPASSPVESPPEAA